MRNRRATRRTLSPQAKVKFELPTFRLLKQLAGFFTKPDGVIDRSLRPFQKFDGFAAQGLAHCALSRQAGGSANHLSATDAYGRAFGRR